MINTKINKVSAQGDNIFIFQYIDSAGKTTEERKSLEAFLYPFIQSYQEQIVLLKNTLKDKQKIQGYLDKEVLELSQKINNLEKEREERKNQITHLLEEVEGKDLSKTTDLYQEAFEHFTNGELDLALSVLEEAKMEEEEQRALESIKQKAETRMLKARLLRIKNQFDKAGQNYEKALVLFTTWGNCLEVADYFTFLNQLDKASQYYKICFDKSASDFEQAITLNDFAVLQWNKNEFEKAEQFYQEALQLRRQLTQINPNTFLPYVAMTLNNLAVLHRAKNELSKAKQFNQEALKIYQELAKVNPNTFLPYVAMTLNNLANLQRARNEFKKAEQSYQESLQLYRKLVQVNPKIYLSYLATTLNNLGNLQSDKNEFEKAEQSYQESLHIRRKLAKVNPNAYLPDVAMTLNNLAVLHIAKNEFAKTDKTFEEALQIRRKLAKVNPNTFLPDVAMTLINLSIYYQEFKVDRKLSIQLVERANAPK